MPGPVLTETALSTVQIMRNVTGRTDASDPAFTTPIMIDYLNAFLQQQHPTEIRVYEDHTWWDFYIDPLTLDPMPVNLDVLGYSTISSPAYISYVTPQPNSFRLSWFEDPGDFYRRWPWETLYTPQMPSAVLYYNNSLTFRGPPDQTYHIRIAAYKINDSFPGGTNVNERSILATVPQAYLTRYLAYGASLNIFADYGEMDRYNEIFPVYVRYRGQVIARTWNQLQSQRTAPDF